ncbi:hypothetical protein NL676_016127 [Syzygium grande]|nr:hypothetical protein NL676_016127 [Syzygium grande]
MEGAQGETGVKRHQRCECGELASGISAEILNRVPVSKELSEELIGGASAENLRQQPKRWQLRARKQQGSL